MSTAVPAPALLPYFYYNPPYVATAVVSLLLFAALGVFAAWNYWREQPRSKTHLFLIAFCLCTPPL